MLLVTEYIVGGEKAGRALGILRRHLAPATMSIDIAALCCGTVNGQRNVASRLRTNERMIIGNNIKTQGEFPGGWSYFFFGSPGAFDFARAEALGHVVAAQPVASQLSANTAQ